MSDPVKEFDAAVQRLIESAREIIADEEITSPLPAERSAERFVESVSAYLDQFEKWTALAERYNSGEERHKLPEAEQNRLRQEVEQLVGLHLQVIDLANQHKDDVAEQMGEVHRRAQGMRRYVDRLPHRITIAGKRQG